MKTMKKYFPSDPQAFQNALKGLVVAERVQAHIEAKMRGAMARVRARWDKAEGKDSPSLKIV